MRVLYRWCAGAKVVKNHKELPGAHMSWVEHILLFVVPRQIVELGEPARRACDACESLGARFKKVIKHLTCRRSITADRLACKRRKTGSGTRGIKKTDWAQCFTRGYVQQSFNRVCVEEAIRHGEGNVPYLLREDMLLRTQGLTGVKRESKDTGAGHLSVYDALTEAIANEEPLPTE